MREREKFKNGKRGYMGKGEVGWPYWVVWGCPPSQRNTKGKEKAKDSEPQKQPEPEPEPEAVPAEEEMMETQSIHATLSETLESPQQSPEPETAIERSASPSPSPPSADPPSPAIQSLPKKSIASALAAELYYLALAEDTDLGFGKPPSREYRRALMERASDVWIWLGEYVKRWGRVSGFGKGKARAVETEREADVEMMDGEGDTSVGDDNHSDGESRARFGVKTTTRKSKRKIDKVD
ncbi:hypothetical protein PQX77_003117 [Marasmius sp. AFHP31]|nr:hypothetical protein PQX77_003117 [Marasmius sp. AFHP31]